jgi:hypothetical protein
MKESDTDNLIKLFVSSAWQENLEKILTLDSVLMPHGNYTENSRQTVDNSCCLFHNEQRDIFLQ